MPAQPPHSGPPPDPPAPPHGQPPRKRALPAALHRLKWPLLCAVCLALLVYLLGPILIAPFIRSKLEEMISSRLDANLRIGRLSYRFPYRLHLRDAVLTARDRADQPVDLLKVPELHITLDRLPFRAGPLVISRLVLENPAVQLIHTDDGLVGGRILLPRPTPESPTTAASPHLSELLELRLLELRNGQFSYQDRRRQQATPIFWRGISLHLATTPTTNPLYNFQLNAANPPLARLNAAGTFNIDELNIALDQLAIHATTDPSQSTAALPEPILYILERHHVRGVLQITGSSQFHLRELSRATFDLTLQLSDATASVSPRHAPLDHLAILLRCSNRPLHPAQELMVTAAALRDEPGDMPPTPNPPATQPIPPSAPDLYLLAENAQAASGDNMLLLTAAGAAFDWHEMTWHLHDLTGRLILGRDLHHLPQPVREAVRQPRLQGIIHLHLSGRGTLKPLPNGGRDYRLNLRAECPHLLTTDRRLALDQVQADLAIIPGAVEILDDPPSGRHGLRAGAYGGTLRAAGRIFPGSPMRYEFRALAADIDLHGLAHDWPKPGEPPLKISGRGFAELHFAGSSGDGSASAADLFTARGEFRVIDGDFYELPVLSQILNLAAPESDAATVGEAAGIFHIARRTTYFDSVAVSAPILGIQGTGTSHFDGQLNMRVVAAPLANWKRQLQRTQIPIVGDVGAEILGAVQKLLNSATGKLLYQFKITGTPANAEVVAQPIPILTDDAVKLFLQMLNTDRKRPLLEELRPTE